MTVLIHAGLNLLCSTQDCSSTLVNSLPSSSAYISSCGHLIWNIRVMVVPVGRQGGSPLADLRPAAALGGPAGVVAGRRRRPATAWSLTLTQRRRPGGLRSVLWMTLRMPARPPALRRRSPPSGLALDARTAGLAYRLPAPRRSGAGPGGRRSRVPRRRPEDRIEAPIATRRSARDGGVIAPKNLFTLPRRYETRGPEGTAPNRPVRSSPDPGVPPGKAWEERPCTSRSILRIMVVMVSVAPETGDHRGGGECCARGDRRRLCVRRRPHPRRHPVRAATCPGARSPFLFTGGKHRRSPPNLFMARERDHDQVPW